MNSHRIMCVFVCVFQSAENGGYIDLSGSERRLSNLETFA